MLNNLSIHQSTGGLVSQTDLDSDNWIADLLKEFISKRLIEIVYNKNKNKF